MTISGINSRFNSYENRLLNDIGNLSRPGGIEKVFAKANRMSTSTFENSNFSTPTDVLGNEAYPGNPVPFGNFITDVDISKDTQAKSDAIQQEREYLRQIYTFLTTNDFRGIASLLESELGVSSEEAERLGQALFREVQQNAPLFLSALEQLDRRLESTQQNLQTQGDLSRQKRQQFDQRISQVVQSIGQG